MKNRKIISLLLYAVVLILLFSWTLGIFGDGTDGLAYSQVVALFEGEQVRSFVVEDNVIQMHLHAPIDGKSVYTASISDADSFRREMWDLIQTQTADGILESYDFRAGKELSPYDFIVPIILAGLAILLVWMILMGRANAKNPMADFGKARATVGQ